MSFYAPDSEGMQRETDTHVWNYAKAMACLVAGVVLTVVVGLITACITPKTATDDAAAGVCVATHWGEPISQILQDCPGVPQAIVESTVDALNKAAARAGRCAPTPPGAGL